MTEADALRVELLSFGHALSTALHLCGRTLIMPDLSDDQAVLVHGPRLLRVWEGMLAMMPCVGEA